MALNRYRLPASGAAGASPAFQTYTHTNSVRRPLPTSDSTALATQAYTPDAADHGVAGDAHHVQFVSDAITTGTVFDIGNTIKFAVQGLEAHANNNQQVQLWVGVYSNDGSTLQQTLRGKILQSSELGTTLAGRFLSTTVGSAYTTVAGDRLVIEISVSGTPGGGGGVQGHNASLRWGADGASGDLAESDGETGTTLNPWFEIQTTDAASPTRGLVSWTEFESPLVPTRGRVSWAELESPLAPTRGLVSFVEFEAQIVATRGLLSWAELETPTVASPTRGLLSWAEVEVPVVLTRGLISWTEFESPEFGLPFVRRRRLPRHTSDGKVIL